MIAGSREAMASTASHSPRGATASRSSVTMPRTRSSWPRTARGVNRRATSLRCSWWPGSSMLIMDMSPRWSTSGRDPCDEE